MNTTIYLSLEESALADLPLFACKISAGVPSPADDHIEKRLNLHDFAVDRDHTSYFVEAEGDSMSKIGILPGTMLVVDKSIKAEDGDIVVAFLDGACLVKRLRKSKGSIWLCPENDKYAPIEVTGNESFGIFGVVISGCTRFRNRSK